MTKPRKQVPRISKKKLAALGGKPPFSTIPKTPKKKIATRSRRKPGGSEYARIYGSKARVEYVKLHPCAGCGVVGYSENAHTESGHGVGYKANASTIAPLCGPHPDYRSSRMAIGCHRRFDEHHPPFNTYSERARIKQAAADIEAAWPTKHKPPQP